MRRGSIPQLNKPEVHLMSGEKVLLMKQFPNSCTYTVQTHKYSVTCRSGNCSGALETSTIGVCQATKITTAESNPDMEVLI